MSDFIEPSDSERSELPEASSDYMVSLEDEIEQLKRELIALRKELIQRCGGGHDTAERDRQVRINAVMDYDFARRQRKQSEPAISPEE